MVVAEFELQHLHQELDVDQAAWAALEVARQSRDLQTAPHLAHRLGILGPPRRSIDGLADLLHRQVGGSSLAEHNAGFAQRLAFPKLPLPFGKILAELWQARGQRSAL